MTTGAYAKAFFGKTGSFMPVVHTMVFMTGVGYFFEYPHIIHEYKANPPSYSKFKKADAAH